MRILCESPAGKTNAERVEAFYRRECGATRQKLDFTDLESGKARKDFAAERNCEKEFALRVKHGAHYNHAPIFRAFCLRRSSLADWNSVARQDDQALRKPKFSRMVGVLRGQRVRNASRARVQRDSQCCCADRRDTPFQVQNYWQGRDEIRQSRDYTRYQQGFRRTGDLLLLVRRAGESDRRRHDFAAGRERISLDGGRSEHALVSSERAGARRADRGYFGSGSRAGAARAEVRASSEADHRRRHHESEIFSCDARKNRGRGSGYFANGLYGRSGLRNLDSMERCSRSVGCARRYGT